MLRIFLRYFVRLFSFNVDELMISGFAVVVHEIGQWDKASTWRVVSKAPRHDKFVTEGKQHVQVLSREAFELRSFEEVANHTKLHPFDFLAEVFDFLQEVLRHPREFFLAPVHGGLWLFYTFYVGLPEREELLFRVLPLSKHNLALLVHDEHCEHVELSIV